MSNSSKKLIIHTLGNQGEEAVAQYLTQQGYRIIARNFKKRGGEIDIIATYHDIIACIEVKTRTKEYFNISEVVTPQKQRKIITTAKYFLMEQKISDMACRFDIATVALDTGTIHHFPGAFTEL